MRFLQLSLIFTGLFISQFLFAQRDTTAKVQREYVYQTFKDTRVININSIETLKRNRMDIRIGHRFGDLAGRAGGFQTFFGLENASDISIGVDYGITDRLQAGFHRSKGGGPYRQLLNWQVKYKILQQSRDNAIPLSLTVGGIATLSTMPRDRNNVFALNHFPKFVHRLAYGVEVHLARKFGNIFSLQLSPNFVWRNYVPSGDENALFGLGLAMRLQVSKILGLILDGNFPFSRSRFDAGVGYLHRMALGLGVEIETAGHTFQVNLTNATGIYLTDYAGYTDAAWSKGQFRIGFTISRIFKF